MSGVRLWTGHVTGATGENLLGGGIELDPSEEGKQVLMDPGASLQQERQAYRRGHKCLGCCRGRDSAAG